MWKECCVGVCEGIVQVSCEMGRTYSEELMKCPNDWNDDQNENEDENEEKTVSTTPTKNETKIDQPVSGMK